MQSQERALIRRFIREEPIRRIWLGTVTSATARFHRAGLFADGRAAPGPASVREVFVAELVRVWLTFERAGDGG